MKRVVGRISFACAVLVALGFSLLPFLWFAAISLKTPVEIISGPTRFWPSGTLSAYRSAIVDHGLARYVGNSALVALATTVVSLLVAATAGYAIARLRFRGRRVLLTAALVASMSPQIAIAGPVWLILRALGLLNERFGLVLPHVSLTLPLAIWLLATFFKELPAEIEEAALIDGCGRLGALVRVVAPVAAPAIFTTAILIFIFSWNEFFFALLILSDPAKQTLPLGIALFPGQYTMPWGEIAAASVFATLPLIVIVFLFQRRIVHGLAAGAIKA